MPEEETMSRDIIESLIDCILQMEVAALTFDLPLDFHRSIENAKHWILRDTGKTFDQWREELGMVIQ